MHQRSDKTTITLGKMMNEGNNKVTCGIRQGCSISTLLFKMVTFCIIEDMEKKGKLYRIDEYIRNSLWLADDATPIGGSKEDMKKKY